VPKYIIDGFEWIDGVLPNWMEIDNYLKVGGYCSM
jgi:hypothetical protein